MSSKNTGQSEPLPADQKMIKCRLGCFQVLERINPLTCLHVCRLRQNEQEWDLPSSHGTGGVLCAGQQFRVVVLVVDCFLHGYSRAR